MDGRKEGDDVDVLHGREGHHFIRAFSPPSLAINYGTKAAADGREEDKRQLTLFDPGGLDFSLSVFLDGQEPLEDENTEAPSISPRSCILS